MFPQIKTIDRECVSFIFSRTRMITWFFFKGEKTQDPPRTHYVKLP
jgi:hypothetical protein